MSQAFLESVLPKIVPVLAALAPDPRSRVDIEKLNPFSTAKIVVSRGGRRWHHRVDSTLPVGEDDLHRLKHCAEAMNDAVIHRIVRLPGIWCALGADGLSPALLPNDGTPKPDHHHGQLLRQAIDQNVRCALLGRKIPKALWNALPAHRRLALEDDRQRLLPTAPPGPEPILVWSDGARALSLSASVLETHPAGIVPLRVLAVATHTSPSSTQSAPPDLAGAPRAPS